MARLRALYDEALACPEVVGLSIGTRPDCLEDEVLELLAGYARERLLWLELGLQSAHDRTLKALNRGHDVACFTRAVERAAARGLEVVAHVILGLPGEGPAEMAATAAYLARLPLQGVKIHLLYVVRGSSLAPASCGRRLHLPHGRGIRPSGRWTSWNCCRRNSSSTASPATRTGRNCWRRTGAWTRPGSWAASGRSSPAGAAARGAGQVSSEGKGRLVTIFPNPPAGVKRLCRATLPAIVSGKFREQGCEPRQ